MLCSMCNQKEAVMDREVDLGYGKVHVFLCESCANKVQQNQPEPTVEVLDFWTQDEGTLVCPKCKATAQDIEKTNYVGCDKCYQVFEPEIERVLTIIQGKCSHVGKSPSKYMSFNKPKTSSSKIKSNIKTERMETGKFNPNDFNRRFFGGADNV